MALLLFDGFDWCGTLNASPTTGQPEDVSRWEKAKEDTSSPTDYTPQTDPPFGSGVALRVPGLGNLMYRLGRDFEASEDFFILGMRVQTNLPGSGGNRIWAIVNDYFEFNASYTVRIECEAMNTGAIRMNVAGGSNYTSATGLLTDHVDYHLLEFKLKFKNSISTGEFQVWVDGTLAIDAAATSDTLAAGEHTIFALDPDQFIDVFDFYIMDSTGTHSNDLIGDGYRVGWLRPNGNGFHSDFTGQDADSVDNYLNVDEVDWDEDTTYNESGTVNDRDSYGLDDIPANTLEVFGVDIVYRMDKKESLYNSRHVKPFMRISGTDYDASDAVFLHEDFFSNFTHLEAENPDTTAQWTLSDINSLEVGIKVES